MYRCAVSRLTFLTRHDGYKSRALVNMDYTGAGSFLDDLEGQQQSLDSFVFHMIFLSKNHTASTKELRKISVTHCF